MKTTTDSAESNIGDKTYLIKNHSHFCDFKIRTIRQVEKGNISRKE